MNIRIKTLVQGNYLDVMKRFDRELFEYLTPIGAKVELIEFTGSKKGDIVHLRFLSPIRSEWISDITEHGFTDQESWFVDEGRQLPWPLKTWTHRHVVKANGDAQSFIVDDMYYSSGNVLGDILLWPALWLTFIQRKPLYKRFFA